MKVICIHPCQFRGVLVQADEVLEVSDTEAAAAGGLFKSSFRRIGTEQKKEKEVVDDHGMTVQNYRDKLDAMKVPYHATDGIDELRKLFDRATSDNDRKRSTI